MPRNLSLFLGCYDLDLVGRKPKHVQSIRRRRSNLRAMFSDPTGKDEKIDASEQSHVGPNRLPNRNGKGIQSKTGSGIIRPDAFLQSFHITLARGERKKTALMIQQVFKRIGIQLLVPQKIENHTRIKIARSRAHGNAASGCESHRGVNRLAVANSTETRPVSEVGKYGSAGQFRGEVMHQRFVRNAVEPITPNPRLKVPLRQRYFRSHLRNGLMEGRIETRELRRNRKNRLRGSHQRQSLWNV